MNGNDIAQQAIDAADGDYDTVAQIIQNLAQYLADALTG